MFIVLYVEGLVLRKLLEVDSEAKGKFIHGARRTKKMWRLNYQ